VGVWWGRGGEEEVAVVRVCGGGDGRMCVWEGWDVGVAGGGGVVRVAHGACRARAASLSCVSEVRP